MPLSNLEERRADSRDRKRLRKPPRPGEHAVGEPARGDYPHGNPAGVVWCPACRQDALPHSETGRCLWDDTLLTLPDADAGAEEDA